MVKVILVILGCVVSVVLIFLFFGIRRKIFFGKFVWYINFVVLCVINGVCLVGLVMIVFLVSSVVLIWLRKIVSGKF